MFSQDVAIGDVLAQQKEKSLAQTFQRLVGVFTITNTIATEVLEKNTETAFGQIGLASTEAH